MQHWEGLRNSQVIDSFRGRGKGVVQMRVGSPRTWHVISGETKLHIAHVSDPSTWEAMAGGAGL